MNKRPASRSLFSPISQILGNRQKYSLILYFLFYCYYPAQAQVNIIETVAGTGYVGAGGLGGFSGDGGPATVAKLNQPVNIAFDTAGNLLILDCVNRRVRKVDAAGTITTIAGMGVGGFSGDGGPAIAAQINPGFGMVTDSLNNIYFLDAGNNRIRKIDAAGIITTIAGNGISGSSPDGAIAASSPIAGAEGLAIDDSGNIYFSEQSYHIVRKINTAGVLSTVAGSGTAGFSGDGGPAVAARLNSPKGLFVDPGGSLYIVDFYNYRFRKVDPTGIISTVAGTGVLGCAGDGAPATSAQFDAPTAAFKDPSGSLYIADKWIAHKVNSAGIISLVAGICYTAGYNGDSCVAAGAASLAWPHDIRTNDSGWVYIADSHNNRIRRVRPDFIPRFTGPRTVHIAMCKGAGPYLLDTFFAALDTNVSQNITWDTTQAYVHGTVHVATSVISTGGPLAPMGAYYMPAPGYTGFDSFKVRVADCIGGADTLTVYVNVAEPVAAYTYTVTASGAGTDTVAFAYTGNPYIDSVRWFFGDDSTSALLNPIHVYTTPPDSFRLCLKVWSVCGHDSLCAWIHPLTTGISFVAASTPVRVYPVPSRDQITIERANGCQVAIYDLLGKQVAAPVVITSNIQTLSISNLAHGVYIVRMTNEMNGQKIIRKIIKE